MQELQSHSNLAICSSLVTQRLTPGPEGSYHSWLWILHYMKEIERMC